MTDPSDNTVKYANMMQVSLFIKFSPSGMNTAASSDSDHMWERL